MQIHGPAHLQTTTSVEGTQSLQPTDAANETHQTNALTSNPAASADEISISQEADLLSRIGDIPDVRQERVYETEDRIDTAVSRLLDEIG